MASGLFGTPDQARQNNELWEFAKAWVGTALAFAVLFSGGQLTNPNFLWILLMTALTAGLGVILHELAHRVVARSFGATAHFVANNGMLIISVLIAFSGFLIAAPGAVWHSGYLTKRQVGLIAAAGPVVNMVLAIMFVGGLLLTQNADVPRIISFGLVIGYFVNAILAVFNMLPFGPLDGAKVLNWSAPVFGILLAIGAGIAFGLPRVFADLNLPTMFGL
jgi:Zn-dependent protease